MDANNGVTRLLHGSSEQEGVWRSSLIAVLTRIADAIEAQTVLMYDQADKEDSSAETGYMDGSHKDA